LQRLQGAFVSDRELTRLVRYWKGSTVSNFTISSLFMN
jgi:DNA segregation ATPase FtsK/SpoIIIE-like protein